MLYWLDIEGRRLHRLDLATNKTIFGNFSPIRFACGYGS